MDQRRRLILKSCGEGLAESSPFYASPQLLTYTRRTFEQLTTDLGRLRDDVFPFAVTSPADLQLDIEGRNPTTGLRYTHISWQGVLRSLCPGASRFLSEVGVATARRHNQESFVDWPFARQIFNKLIETRFRLIRGDKLMGDDRSKLIFGQAGAELRGGDLLAFLEQVEHGRRMAETHQVFYAATLCGNRLRLWYREPEPFAVAMIGADSQPLYRGTVFHWAGWVRSALRAMPCIVTKIGVATAPRKKCGALVVWKGTCDLTEAANTAERMFRTELPVGDIREGIDRWMGMKLGFSRGVGEAAVTSRFRTILKSASGLAVPHGILRAVLDAAMASAGGAGILRPTSQDDMAGCTVGHFVAKLLPVARSLSSTYQEACETFAYRILTGRQI